MYNLHTYVLLVMKVTFDLLVYNVHASSCTVSTSFSILLCVKPSYNFHAAVELCVLPLPSIKLHIRLATVVQLFIKLGTG